MVYTTIIYVLIVNLLFQEPVEKWPLCDCLIAFHSKGKYTVGTHTYCDLNQSYIIKNIRYLILKNFISLKIPGFPLEKAIEYTKLRKPYIINNLEMQYDIQDRRSVYRILEREGIELPRHSVFDRTSNNPLGMSSCQCQMTISDFTNATNLKFFHHTAC